MKTRKLLNKTLKHYVAFCVAYLLLAIPLFYYASNKIYEHELNEYLTDKQDSVAIDIQRITHEAKEVLIATTALQILFFVGLMVGFVLLTKTILRAYKTQKEFTENASHEMQTPLAVFQSKLDILLQQPNLSEEQLRIMQSLYDVTSRLVRMNKNLLLLAKMDNLQFPETENLNVSQIIKESLSFLSEQAEENSIHIEMNIATEPHFVQANKILLESLINNLIANAIKHNIPNGTIAISFQNRQLRMENTGATQELDKTILFRRFVRMNEKTSGSGLGLAIVQQICMLYHWRIDYQYKDEKHQFSVNF